LLLGVRLARRCGRGVTLVCAGWDAAHRSVLQCSNREHATGKRYSQDLEPISIEALCELPRPAASNQLVDTSKRNKTSDSIPNITQAIWKSEANIVDAGRNTVPWDLRLRPDSGSSTQFIPHCGTAGRRSRSGHFGGFLPTKLSSGRVVAFLLRGSLLSPHLGVVTMNCPQETDGFGKQKSSTIA